MARGPGWWGTPPLAVGAGGLLLLAFGAKWMPGDNDVNENARKQATAVEQQLKYAETRGEARAVLAEAEEMLKAAGKPADLEPLLDKAGKDPGPVLAGPVRDLIYDALQDRRDGGVMIAGRIAFYGGLVLVFTAGVLLYRRTPESNQGTW